MSDFNKTQQEESKYLENTLETIYSELKKEEKSLEGKTADLISSRREMWQESVHFSDDLDRIPEINHYLSEVNNETRNYVSARRRVDKLKKMLYSPYFGRFDFQEEGFDEVENIYIGLYNLMDSKTDEIYVYDWRSPIASIFYRNELGKGSYKSPVGYITGNILLKRQYKIEDSKLKYFFDCSIRINDEILQEVLSRNSSNKMRSIVETIQKEQDLIIRDTENELLIVQGVAGSGKTSIALHRIAFLLYEGLSSKISASNVIIISPNNIFSKYISEVLPELGEENVEQITFDNLALKLLNREIKIEKRQEQLEDIIFKSNKEDEEIRNQSIRFKGSTDFTLILDRLVEYCETKLIDFKDVYYDGKIIETKQEMRNFFLNNKVDMPIAKKLKRIENMILNKIHPLRKERLEKLEKIVQKSDEHVFEIKAFSRLLAVKEAKKLMDHIRTFSEIDYLKIYKYLFSKEGLMHKLSAGLELPENIDRMIDETRSTLDKGYISYEDSAALLYLKLKLEGNDEFTEIKQVVIDEAQDYYPLQYKIFNMLFKGARYTVLGDFNQTLEKTGKSSIYEEIEKILCKKKSVKLTMNKSYRSSFEINAFNQRLLDYKQELQAFERHEDEPQVLCADSEKQLLEEISKYINIYFEQGFGSVAVICKTDKEARELEKELKCLTKVKLLNTEEQDLKGSAVIIPAYMAKGLEFDSVLVYNASDENYRTAFDKRLLYIACTRALHRLNLFSIGPQSRFI